MITVGKLQLPSDLELLVLKLVNENTDFTTSFDITNKDRISCQVSYICNCRYCQGKSKTVLFINGTLCQELDNN